MDDILYDDHCYDASLNLILQDHEDRHPVLDEVPSQQTTISSGRWRVFITVSLISERQL
jgi:hypothetical protein